MHKTTNILLVIVIVLLVSIGTGNLSNKNVYAEGAASSDPIIYSVSSDSKNVFLVNTEKSIMLHYKINKGFMLKSARKFDYDVQIDSYRNAPGNGYTYKEVKDYVTGKTKKAN